MPSPRDIRKLIPGYIDDFIYTLHRWIMDEHWENMSITEEYLLKIYHSFVYILTLHDIKWKKVESFRKKRPRATPLEDRLIATSNPIYADAFQGEFLHGLKPQPPANYVVEMFEQLCSERKKEKQLLRFFSGLKPDNYFKPTIVCIADYNRQPDSPFHTKGVNVACDDATKGTFRDNLKDSVFHPVIFCCYESPSSGNGLRGLQSNSIKCVAKLVASWETGKGKPRPPCHRCFSAFPGVNWRPKSANRPGRDQFPVGNCAEACAFSKLLFEARVPGSPPNTLQEDKQLKHTYEKRKRKFDLMLEKKTKK